jgi:transposase
MFITVINMRFNIGTERYQYTLLSLDDQIAGDNVVRFIDKVCGDFISSKVLVDIFAKGAGETGRKAYRPCDMLRLYVYAYFNGVSSSRKIERECRRNIELRWLLSGLAPDHKTISDFRKDNADLIREFFLFLNKAFVDQGLVKGKSIAVDGTKVKAYASRGAGLDELRKKLENVEDQIETYLKKLSDIDRAEEDVEQLEDKKADLEKQIGELESKKKGFEASLEELKKEGLDKKCLTDPEAKKMKGRYGTYWGFNLQIAVDTQSHMVTEYRLTSNQNDKGLLEQMATGSETVTGEKPVEVYADGGYYKGTELDRMEQNGTECFVAVNHTSAQLGDRKNGIALEYNRQEDLYTCSQGRRLLYHRKKTENGETKRIYKSEGCGGCPLVAVCTKSGTRTTTRNENQEWIDAYHRKMDSREGRERMKKRKSVAEHPFGTMKYYMGQTPVLLRGKRKVSTEMALYVIGYNIRRYMAAKREERGQKGAVSGKIAA